MATKPTKKAPVAKQTVATRPTTRPARPARKPVPPPEPEEEEYEEPERDYEEPEQDYEEPEEHEEPEEPAAKQTSETALARTGSINKLATDGKVTAGLPIALSRQGESLLKAMKGAIGPTGALSLSDLPRITVPPGGGKAWTIPNQLGDDEVVKTFTGVIAYWKDAKAFWRQSIDEQGSGNPPDCRSDDLIHGVGDPGVACAACEFNQFGSAKDNTGDGKACKDLRLMFILRGNSALPVLLAAPPTSLKSVRQFFLALAGQGIPYNHALITFALEQDKQRNGGITYSKIKPIFVERLSEEEAARAESYTAILEPIGRQAMQAFNQPNDEKTVRRKSALD